jgi:hypothetical protein
MERHKKSYVYTIRQNHAIWLLENIYEYLLIFQKKKRAELIITEYKKVTKRNGRYTKEEMQAKLEFYKTFMAV